MAGIPDVTDQQNCIRPLSPQSSTLLYNNFSIVSKFNAVYLIIPQYPTSRTFWGKLSRQTYRTYFDSVFKGINLRQFLFRKYQTMTTLVLNISSQVGSRPFLQKIIEIIVSIVKLMISYSSPIDLHIIHKTIQQLTSSKQGRAFNSSLKLISRVKVKSIPRVLLLDNFYQGGQSSKSSLRVRFFGVCSRQIQGQCMSMDVVGCSYRYDSSIISVEGCRIDTSGLAAAKTQQKEQKNAHMILLSLTKITLHLYIEITSLWINSIEINNYYEEIYDQFQRVGLNLISFLRTAFQEKTRYPLSNYLKMINCCKQHSNSPSLSSNYLQYFIVQVLFLNIFMGQQKNYSPSYIIFAVSQNKQSMQAFAGASLSGIISYFAVQYASTPKQDTLSKEHKQQSSTQNTFFKATTITHPFRTIAYPHFNILYSTYHKAPLAVHQLITKQLAQGDAPRSRFFYPEDHITQKHFQVDNSYYADTQAFARFNLNRGHMAAAGNYSGNQSQKFHTFTFANVIPQNGHNNGGIWNTFERYSRSLALSDKCQSVQIISGPIYPQNSPYSKDSQKKEVPVFRSVLKVLKQDGAPIPQKLYKIIKCNSKAGPYVSTYQFLNKETQENDKVLSSFEVQLENVQRQTGLKFNISGKALRQIDAEGLSKTKKQLDYPFFFGLMERSEKIGEMNECLRRAKSQQIQIQLNDLTPRIRQLTGKEIGEISNQQSTSCQKLKNMFDLSKKLYYLKNLQQTEDLRIPKMEQNYTQCKTSGGEEYQTLAKDYKYDIKRLEQALNTKST